MTYSKYRFISGCVVFFFANITGACSMFFEDDIADEELVILAPADGTTTEVLTHTFWWSTIVGADSYRLQIVSPSFDETEVLLLDSLLDSDKFVETLYPGQFQLRVRGENNGYVTEWAYSSLIIFSSEDLTRQRVQLKSPAEKAFVNAESIEFSWDHLMNAESYDLKIYGDNWGQDAIVDSSGIIELGVNLDNLEERAYWWGVKAQNETSETLFSNRPLVIDRTPPENPTLESPQNNAILSDSTVVFSWDSNDPVWSKVLDELIIVEKREGATDVQVHSDTYDGKTATVNLFRGRKYSWKIQSIDQAGNESEISNEQQFTINN
ncbi:hypothetical protein JCM15548_14365 [Geofilum rubicundum JCM 15548]|uniref:Fibronectin type-III domain-containing protein n=2 Tax=Geofilum TaxID=1236988 RepID=A0A0E9M450_9BACT|nr:hypothetical protein JCM15548_14365 [Geofilum rubicundum JCM 15548]